MLRSSLGLTDYIFVNKNGMGETKAFIPLGMDNDTIILVSN